MSLNGGDDQLKQLAAQVLSGHVEINDLLRVTRWREIYAGVFVTAYFSRPFTSDTVWCCMSNGEYGGKKTVNENTKESARICANSDSRRSRSSTGPIAVGVTVLAPRSTWLPINANQALRSDGATYAVVGTNGRMTAIYLPSVWEEETSWSGQDLAESLRQKAGIFNEYQLFRVPCYEITPDASIGSPRAGFWEAIGSLQTQKQAGDGFNLLHRSTAFGFCPCNHHKSKPRVFIRSAGGGGGGGWGNDVRPLTHRGSWYESDVSRLSKQLDGWIEGCYASITGARILIVPHAGYQYSGSFLGCAYRCIRPTVGIKRVFILGPSHFTALSGCAMSSCLKYDAPWGQMSLDRPVINKLLQSGLFSIMDRETEDNEHSLEMQLPFLSYVLQSGVTLIPVLVGQQDSGSLDAYGRVFSNYLSDPSTLFIVSSDFCHWGARYQFTYRDLNMTVNKSIENLDRTGIRHIVNGDPIGFSQYLTTTRNTICGQHAISILLRALDPTVSQLLLIKYGQSEQVQVPTQNDAIVSYAAIVGPNSTNQIKSAGQSSPWSLELSSRRLQRHLIQRSNHRRLGGGWSWGFDPRCLQRHVVQRWNHGRSGGGWSLAFGRKYPRVLAASETTSAPSVSLPTAWTTAAIGRRHQLAIILLDWDAPYPDRPTFAPYLHWMKIGNSTVVPYRPMRPPSDSAPHHYQLRAYEVEPNVSGALINLNTKGPNFDLKAWEQATSAIPLGVIQYQASS